MNPGLITPQKRRQLVLSGNPLSPLQKKKTYRFLPSIPSNLAPETPTRPTLLYTMNMDDETGRVPDIPTVPVLTSPFVSSSSSNSLSMLARETHEERLSQQDSMAMNKGTDTAYSRHLKNYENWWEKDQARRVQEEVERSGTLLSIIPAHPINITKVSLFLKYETARTKHSPDGMVIVSSRLGPSSIRQCISALEYTRYRLQHREDYVACPESQKPLRDDIRIKMFEKSADAKEPERLIQMHLNKADGIKSDTFSEEELIRAMVHLLQNPASKSPSKIHIALRTRLMVLISSSMAFRGDNTRNILWSDIFIRDIPLVDIGLDYKAPALVIFSNQGKENTTGRMDEQGAFRHRIPELCPIGALAFYYFTLFQVMKTDVPNFAPDYSSPEGGPIGVRDWYSIYLFPGEDGHSGMTYGNHRKHINKLLKDTNIHIKKVTHSGRPFAVEQAAKWGASVESRMALGGWSSNSGSFKPCYDRALPTDAMLGAAGFNAQKQTSYFLPRDVLKPSPQLLSSIFPWVEAEQRALESRIQQHGRNGEDNALKLLLSLLIFLRHILLQDAAVLYASYPESPVFKYAPFDSAEFQEFSSTSMQIIANAEAEARHKLEKLPYDVAETFRGLVTTNAMHHAESRKFDNDTRFMIEENLRIMMDFTKANALRGLTGKKRKAAEAAINSLDIGRPAPAQRSSPVTGSEVSAVTSSSAVGTACVSPAPAAEPATTSMPPQVFISPSGGVYPFNVFPLSNNPEVRTRQEDEVVSLEKIFTFQKLIKHRFEWEEDHKSWLPEFDAYWKPPGAASASIDDIWAENRFGIDGKFSIQELDAKWSARWRRNKPTLKTEGSRRNKVIKIIEKLASENTNWNSALALRFLHEKYPTETKTARSFYQYLNAKTTVEIMAASKSYP